MTKYEDAVQNEILRQQQEYDSEVAKIQNLADQSDWPDARKNEFVSMGIAGLKKPMSEAEIRHLYSYLQEIPQAEELDISEGPDFASIVYKVGNKYWNVREARFVTKPKDKNCIVELGGPATNENLLQNLEYYRDTVCPWIEIGPELLSQDELFASLRKKRDALISATDYLMSPDYPITVENREAVITYRQALRDITSQEGAPWDGGGDATPWPAKPEV